MLKVLRTKCLNLEEFDQFKLDKIKDLFQYLQIPMPISMPSLQWDASKCYGGIGVQHDGSAIITTPSSTNSHHSMALGTEGVSRFSVKLGEGLSGFTASSVGFISSDDFGNSGSIIEKGWSMAFIQNNGANFSIQFISHCHPCVAKIADCTLMALHREDSHEIVFKLISKEGHLLLECSFQDIPTKKLYPFVFCDGSKGRRPCNDAVLLKFQ